MYGNAAAASVTCSRGFPFLQLLREGVYGNNSGRLKLKCTPNYLYTMDDIRDLKGQRFKYANLVKELGPRAIEYRGVVWTPRSSNWNSQGVIACYTKDKAVILSGETSGELRWFGEDDPCRTGILENPCHLHTNRLLPTAGRESYKPYLVPKTLRLEDVKAILLHTFGETTGWADIKQRPISQIKAAYYKAVDKYLRRINASTFGGYHLTSYMSPERQKRCTEVAAVYRDLYESKYSKPAMREMAKKIRVRAPASYSFRKTPGYLLKIPDENYYDSILKDLRNSYVATLIESTYANSQYIEDYPLQNRTGELTIVLEAPVLALRYLRDQGLNILDTTLENTNDVETEVYKLRDYAIRKSKAIRREHDKEVADSKIQDLLDVRLHSTAKKATKKTLIENAIQCHPNCAKYADVSIVWRHLAK